MLSSFKLPVFLMISSLLLHATLGNIICEDLPKDKCAFSISSSGKRCLLEKDHAAGGFHCNKSAVSVDGRYNCRKSVVGGGYYCRTSEVIVDGIKNYVETNECIAACGVDRETIGISSDALLERGFAAKLCSSDCYDNCPNLVDLYFNLVDGEGAFLPLLCDAQRANPHRSLFEILSSGSAAGPDSADPAPSPTPM